jgi:hypothetical protein
VSLAGAPAGCSALLGAALGPAPWPTQYRKHIVRRASERFQQRRRLQQR